MLDIPSSVTSILIDTCFLVDSKEYPSEFKDFLEQISARNIDTYSIEFVKIEYIRARTSEEINTKLEYFNKIVGGILPIEKIITQEDLKQNNKDRFVVDHLGRYGNDLDGVSITDLYLGMCLNRYKSIYLLTANHKDFPIYKRECILPIETRRGIKTYALYRSK